MPSDAENAKLLPDRTAHIRKDPNYMDSAYRCALIGFCLAAIWAVVSVFMGMIAGYSFTKLCYGPFTGLDGLLHSLGFLCKDGQIAPQLSKCDEFFCGADDGPMYTPVNVTGSLDVWAPECTPKQLLEAFENFSSSHPFSLVSFRSRPGGEGQETVDLKAWWLPAPEDDGRAPRIVVQHGNNVNFNDDSVMLAAYLLRSLGFSVLLPNHRHHGIRHVGQKIRWGYDLFLDVLGAWDYAVKDPDGALGGPLDPDKVGVMGVSMGGFSSLVAMGYEPDIPAVWIDAGVFDLKDELNFQMESALPVGPALGLAEWLGWHFASFFSGADIALYEPAPTLKLGARQTSRTRSVQVVQGLLDAMVPSRQAETLVEALEAEGAAYNVSTLFKMYSCGGERYPFPNHVHMHAWRPDTYRSRLCSFWSYALGTSSERCEMKGLPIFPECETSICDSPP